MKNVDDKLLYRLLVQFLVFSQGQNRVLDPYIFTIRQKLKQGSSIVTLNSDLLKLSKAIDVELKQQPNAVSTIQNNLCIKHLEELLNGIIIPAKFQPCCNAILKKLPESLDGEAFERLLDSAVSLIFDISRHMQSEQQETEKFLEDISKQLTQLDRQTRMASESNLASHADRETLDADIHSQIDNIKLSASCAQELSSLQKNITLHLQELTTKLQTYKQTEDSRLSNTQKQLNEMSKQLQDLEEEANFLRDNLKLAHARAFLDPLTGLPNRLAYNEKIDRECKYWQRYKTPMCVFIWDIDHFKRVNDVYGHKAGDKTLALVAQLLKSNCRETDFIARYGGEEFIMLLHNVNAKQSLATAEKIRRLVAHSDFHYQGEKVQLTLSCGISEFLEGDVSHEEVFERADRALYQSKKQGRNRCTIFQRSLT